MKVKYKVFLYNQNYLRNDVRRCFATYKIKKKHLIFCDLPEKECEVIADPNNAELVRYDFINDQMDIDSAIYNFRTKPLFENHLDKVCKDLVKQNDFLMIKDDFGRVCQISYKDIDLENLLRFQ